MVLVLDGVDGFSVDCGMETDDVRAGSGESSDPDIPLSLNKEVQYRLTYSKGTQT